MSKISLHKRRNASTLRCFDIVTPLKKGVSKQSSWDEAQQADLQLIELGAELIEVVEMSDFIM